MKKLCALLITCIVIFTACPSDDGNENVNFNGGGGGGAPTTLRIRNESSKAIRNIVWNSVVFNDAQNPVNSGNNIVKPVGEGTGYIFFDFYSVSYRTSSVIVVEKDENAEFTFTNNTVIVEVNNANNSITIGNLPIPPTTLTVTNSTAYDLFTVEYGDIDFGSTNRGSSNTKNVNPGTKYMEISVYFPLGNFGVIYMTIVEAITCEEGMPNQFTVTNNTVVTAATGERGTLKNIVDSKTEEGKHGENGDKK